MARSVTVVLVGAGVIGEVHLSAVSALDSIQYVGIVDNYPSRANALSAKYNVPVFETLSEAIRVTSANAVDICTPPRSHLELIKICAEAKVDVLCEKPIALSIEDALEIKNVSENAGIRVMVGQVLRFWPDYIYANSIVSGKDYGSLKAVHLSRLSALPKTNSWMCQQDQGGGAAIDLQIHDLDFLLKLSGWPSASTSYSFDVSGGVNHITNLFKFTNNSVGSNEASYSMPDSFIFRMKFSINLEHAAIEFDSWLPVDHKIKLFPNDGPAFNPSIKRCNPFSSQLEYFSEIIIKDTPCSIITIDEAINALRLCLLTASSAKPIKL